jgi:hypothetical protein
MMVMITEVCRQGCINVRRMNDSLRRAMSTVDELEPNLAYAKLLRKLGILTYTHHLLSCIQNIIVFNASTCANHFYVLIRPN